MIFALIVQSAAAYLGIGLAVALRVVDDLESEPLAVFAFCAWPAFLVGYAAYRLADKIARKII